MCEKPRAASMKATPSASFWVALGGIALLPSGGEAIVREATAESPAERMRLAAVPVRDEAKDSANHLVGADEVRVLEDAPLKDGESDLDLVHPRGMLGR